MSFTLDAHEVPSNKLKILVVDDDDTLRETIVALLSLQGHHIVTTNTAEGGNHLVNRLGQAKIGLDCCRKQTQREGKDWSAG